MIVVLLFYLSELCVHVFCSLNFVGIRGIFLSSTAFSLRARLTFICATLPMRGRLRVVLQRIHFVKDGIWFWLIAHLQQQLSLDGCGLTDLLQGKIVSHGVKIVSRKRVSYQQHWQDETELFPGGGLPFFAYANCGSSRYSYE